MTTATRPASTTSRSDATAAPDAIKLLTADHKHVKQLYQQYKKLAEKGADAAERVDLAHRICTALTVHATAEEEIFYPAVREAIDEPLLFDEAEVEHDSAKTLIAQIESTDPEDDDLFDARVIVLCEYVEHHVEEEESEMFPKARAVKGIDLQALGAALAERKAELEAELNAAEADTSGDRSTAASRKRAAPRDTKAKSRS
jgi:hemerythrin superfamily protein